MFNITSFLDIRAKEEPDKIILIHPTSGREYTWENVCGTVRSMSTGLCRLGITKGDRVVLFLGSSPEYLLWYFAIWRIGAVVVPANSVYRGEELSYVVEDSGASCLITDDEGLEVARTVARDLQVPHLIAPSGGTTSWDEIVLCPPLNRPVPCHGDDICQIQYTSGTTGRPKGAVLTHSGWAAALSSEAEALDLTSDDRYLGIYPMGHVGISWGISVLKTGGSWVIMERFQLEAYINLIEAYRITILSGMPPVIHSLVESPSGTEARFKSVRRIISGGGPMHSPTWHAFHTRFAIPIINAYGLSETIVLGAGTVVRPDHYPHADEFNSVGTPVGYTEVKIVDTEDPSYESAPGSQGEIALRGPGVAKGYWNKPEDTKAVFLPDGWFLTGDIGFLDKDGMLVITDRKKDMIIMSGWKVYPTEVEHILIRHPKVADIAIFGYPDEEKGEIPAAAVVLRDGCELTQEELTAYAREHLAGYKIPRRMIVVESLPRANGWKLMRRELRNQDLAS
ncbi:MAG TPA: AMP-binding protein [Methanospirillum sp.]|nr:AMP-binding protein [Methanospirillum sp.]